MIHTFLESLRTSSSHTLVWRPILVKNACFLAMYETVWEPPYWTELFHAVGIWNFNSLSYVKFLVKHKGDIDSFWNQRSSSQKALKIKAVMQGLFEETKWESTLLHLSSQIQKSVPMLRKRAEKIAGLLWLQPLRTFFEFELLFQWMKLPSSCLANFYAGAPLQLLWVHCLWGASSSSAYGQDRQW